MHEVHWGNPSSPSEKRMAFFLAHENTEKSVTQTIFTYYVLELLQSLNVSQLTITDIY